MPYRKHIVICEQKAFYKQKSVRTVLYDISQHVSVLTEAKQGIPIIYNSDKWSKLSGLNCIFIEEVWESSSDYISSE